MTMLGDAGAARPALDLARMRERLGDDEALVADVIRLFLDDYPMRLDAIAAAIQARDPMGLRRAAHALKGSASALSAQGVAEAARALEAIGEADDLALADQRFAALVAEAERLAAVLREFQRGKP